MPKNENYWQDRGERPYLPEEEPKFKPMGCLGIVIVVAALSFFLRLIIG